MVCLPPGRSLTLFPQETETNQANPEDDRGVYLQLPVSEQQLFSYFFSFRFLEKRKYWSYQSIGAVFI